MNKSFFQDPPRIGNQYLEDSALQACLTRILPKEVKIQVDADLTAFGSVVATTLFKASKEMDQPHNRPFLQPYDAWGNRVDDIVTCQQWKNMKDVSAQEGLVAIGYERKYGEFSRVVQFAKLMMFYPSSGLFSCPLAMTDGAARCCEALLAEHAKNHKLDTQSATHLKEAFRHLTSRDPETFWTSGQWMTERAGGSDVGNATGTTARKQPDGSYKLYGFKWFTSATDADMTITLARIEDEKGKVLEGSKGLSCFFLRVRKEDGSLNGIRIARLKDKMGTKQLPTAELELDGAEAHLISEAGRGVATIAHLLNITRLYNSICAVGGLRRMVALHRDFAHRRSVFGLPLAQQPLHLETLAGLEVTYRALLQLTFDAVRLLGQTECASSSSSSSALLLRLLTPCVKLYSGKLGLAGVSEAVEGFGGAGYVEDTGLPTTARDAQVLTIWEGTTNVLSHDVLRVLQTTKGKAFEVYRQTVLERCRKAQQAEMKTEEEEGMDVKACIGAITKAVEQMSSFLQQAMGSAAMVPLARDFSFALARTYTASVLLEHAVWSRQTSDLHVLQRWIMDGVPLMPPTIVTDNLVSSTVARLSMSRHLALDVDEQALPRGYGNQGPDGKLRAKL